jgi:hypothetical protein
MSASPAPTPAIRPSQRRSASAVTRPQASAPWAALAIATMWIAVLLVGLFGGDIVSETAGATSSRVPSAVAVAVLALIATIFVARWGLRPDARVAELEAELEEERQRCAALEHDLDGLRRTASETSRSSAGGSAPTT